jgi:hypothetical protein
MSAEHEYFRPGFPVQASGRRSSESVSYNSGWGTIANIGTGENLAGCADRAGANP